MRVLVNRGRHVELWEATPRHLPADQCDQCGMCLGCIRMAGANAIGCQGDGEHVWAVEVDDDEFAAWRQHHPDAAQVRTEGAHQPGDASACCAEMELALTEPCGQHEPGEDCPDRVIRRSPDGYGIPIRDGGTSFVVISFCPWCGARLTA